MGGLTLCQSQVQANAAAANINNYKADDDIEQLKLEPTIKKIAVENIHINLTDKLFVYYKHEKRLQPFERNIHQLYGNAFHKTSAMNLKLIVGNRNCRDTKYELIQKRPKRTPLQNILLTVNT